MSQATSGSLSAGFSASDPPTLLHLPRGVLACIASKFDSPKDRLSLEASCHTLLAASRGELSSIYWGGPRLVFSFYSDEDVEDATALLAARRPTVSALNLETSSEIPYDAPLLPSPPLPGLKELRLLVLGFSPPEWDSVLQHSHLTSLVLANCWFYKGAGAQPLRVLNALQQLEMSGPRDDEGYPVSPPPCLQLAGCSQLTSLTLSSCDLGDLPPGLTTLSALCSLHVRCDDLSAAQHWSDLTHLRQLTQLKLERCYLEEVPEPLSHLTALRNLWLHANWDLERAWERLAPLTGLTFLSLAYTQFSHLPAVLSQLTGLETLDLLGCNQLTASDEAWRPLQGHPSLRFLNAMWCEGLAAVPALLSTLRRLEDVNFCLSGRLREGGGWRHLTALSSLTRLSLTGCGLQGMPAELAAFAEAGIARL